MPLPADDAILLTPPDPNEVAFDARGVLSAVGLDGQCTEFQILLVQAMFTAMTGHGFEPSAIEPITAAEFAIGMRNRNEAFRTRIVQTMILAALVLRPLPIEVADRVGEFSSALGVADGMLDVARNFAEGQLALAAVDFDRNGYTSDWSDDRSAALHSTGLAEAWALSVDDLALATRWEGLGELASGTLGRRLFELYRARGFEFPGRAGSAPPLLAQHDWVHVLADYGTTVESELEVFGFIARANDDPRGFSLLAMVVSLFETGYLDHGAGLFDAFPGQLSRDGMAVRLADGMRRGALSHGLDGAPDVDFLGLDWFTIADQPISDLRTQFNIVAKSDAALEAGSVGPWEPGGISQYQYATASAAAGDDYDSYGATP